MNSRTVLQMNERAALNVLSVAPEIEPARLPATEAVAHQTVRAAPPPRNPAAAGDDFGFFIGLAIACPLGALGWWLIAQALQLGLAQ